MPHGTLTNPTVVPSSRHYRFRVRANARYKLSHKLGDISVHLDNHRMNSFSMDTAMVYSHAAGKGSCLCADPADLRYPPPLQLFALQLCPSWTTQQCKQPGARKKGTITGCKSWPRIAGKSEAAERRATRASKKGTIILYLRWCKSVNLMNSEDV